MALQKPFFPGYYPGDPYVRRPRRKYRRPREYVDPLEAIDEFFKDIEPEWPDYSSGSVPRWLWEQYLNDISLAAVATVKPASYGAAIYEYGAEEAEELPGAVGVSVKLSPSKWLEDPKKMFVDTVKGWGQSVLDVQDFDARAKAAAWKKLIEESGSPYGMDGMEVFDTRKRKGSTTSYVALDGSRKDVHVDVYEKVKKGAVDYCPNSFSFLVRPGSFRSFQRESIRAFRVELQSKRAIVENALNVSTAFTAADKSRILESIDTFIKESDVAERMEEIGKFLREDISEMIGKNLLDTGGPERDKITGYLIHDEYNKLLERIENFEKDFVDPAGTAEFKKLIEPYHQILLDVKRDVEGDVVKGIEGLTKIDSTVKGRIAKSGWHSVELYRRMGVHRDKIANIRAVPGFAGAEDVFLRKVAERNIKDSGSDLNRISTLTTTTGDYILSDGYRNLRNLYGGIFRDFNWQSAGDFANQIADGKVLKSLFWFGYTKVRLGNYTAAHYVGKFLGRAHYFGLIIDDDVVSGKVKGSLIFKSKIFDNRFKLKYLSKGVEHTFKTVGGKHYAGPLALMDQFEKTGVGATKFSDKVVGPLLNPGDPVWEDFIRYVNNDLYLSDLLPEKGQKEFLENLAEHKKYLFGNQKELGLVFDSSGKLVDSAENREILASFYKSLADRQGRSGVISAARAKAGFLEKISAGLTQIQVKFLQETALGKTVNKVLTKYNVLKVKIAEVLINLFSKVFPKLLAAASNVVTPVIGFIATVIATYLVKRLTNIIKGMVKTIVNFAKMDYEKILEDVEKEATKMVKLLGIIIGVPCGCLTILASITLLVIIAAISPIDPTRSGGFTGRTAGDFGNLGLAECTDVATPLGGTNTATNAQAKFSWDIINEMKQGFWCFWNHSPSYDGSVPGNEDLFDEAEFQRNPFPGDKIYECASCLFWCTHLPVKAYASAGDALSGVSLRADKMKNYFKDERIYLDADSEPVVKEDGTLNVFPGDVIFIHSKDGRLGVNHVGMVYEVTKDYVRTVHANSGLKEWSYTVDPEDGQVQGNPYHKVEGFGR